MTRQPFGAAPEEWSIQALRARVADLEAALTSCLVSAYGYWHADERRIVAVIRCDCGARVEGEGRDVSKVELAHMGTCPLRGGER
jgi:hypothetical protein